MCPSFCFGIQYCQFLPPSYGWNVRVYLCHDVELCLLQLIGLFWQQLKGTIFADQYNI